MELISIEETRVTNLINFLRPAGQLYVPDAVEKLALRYKFVKYPTLAELGERRNALSFGVGKFADTQISKFEVYNDGFVVEAKTNSKVLDAFMDEVVAWSAETFGFRVAGNSKPERHHESTLIVTAGTDIAKAFAPRAEIVEALNKALGKEGYAPRKFQAAGMIMSPDPTAEGSKKIEPRFLIDRRMGLPFAENVFYSQAPLPTDDHLAVLERVEDLAKR